MSALRSQLRAVKGHRRSNEIVSQVQELIASDELSVGERLPSERELSEIFEVSRGVVREALIQLEGEGLIDIRHGAGIFVTTDAIKALGSPLAGHLFLQTGGIRDLFELRIGLECEAAALAAVRRNDEELASLERAMDDLEYAVERDQIGTDSDVRFHLLISQATHNHTLSFVVDTVQDGFRRSIALARARSLRVSGRPQIVLLEHKRVLARIRGKDAHGAWKAMRDHLDRAHQRLVRKGEGISDE